MQPSELRRAIAAATSTVSGLGLSARDAVVIHNSNRVALRLMPCDILARVAGPAHAVVAELELEIVDRLADLGAPVAGVDPRVGRRVYEQDGFFITLWTYYEPVPAPMQPSEYADALERLHLGLRKLNVETPHFSDRVAEAHDLVARPDLTPALAAADRQFLSNALRSALQAIGDRPAIEQVLHGEPHPGNVLNTKDGPLFIDFETVCRGPIEFDLAHLPELVSDRYAGVDEELLRDCRGLVVAMVAAWRFDRNDQLPNGHRAGRQLIDALRAGPPYPGLEEMLGDE